MSKRSEDRAELVRLVRESWFVGSYRRRLFYRRFAWSITCIVVYFGLPLLALYLIMRQAL